MEPHLLTATEAAAAIAAGRLSAAELMEACLARAAARDPVVRAFAWLDPGRARRNAAAARPGPLHGIPFGVKDVIETGDMPTQNGSPIYAGNRPRGDAACVAAAKAAGGAIMGKTVTTEFATRNPGPTTNPHHAGHTPGGSSSGSAAAVADGMLPIAFGTQTAGSIVRPAAYCGVVGYKPSFGTLHRGGMKVCSESLDTIGIMARSVADCALAMGAMSGRNLGNPEAQREKPPRLGLTLGHAPEAATPEMAALLHQVADAARARGAEVVDFALPAEWLKAAELHPWLMNMETRQALAWEYDNARPQLSAVLLDRLDWSGTFPQTQLRDARIAQRDAIRVAESAFAGFDAILTPSAPGEAPEGLHYTGDATFNLLWTTLWGPNVTIPVGKGPKGLPLGVQLVGPIGRDAEVLSAARWVQAAMG
jgi:Asp-tRNA(Asn)/Glu-tRNA(Gln) amidotransferase A subunit family amidase